MRQECVDAVQSAAKTLLNKVLSNADLRGIESRITSQMPQIYRSDIAKWSKASKDELLAEAAKRATAEIVHEKIKRRQRAELVILKEREIDGILEKSREAGNSAIDALLRFGFTIQDMAGKSLSVEAHSNAISNDYKSRLEHLFNLEREGNLLNLLTNKEGQRAFILELYGKDSGNPLAKKAADEWLILAEIIRKDYNRFGGDIGKLEDYRTPQKLDMYKLFGEGSKKNRDEFLDFAITRIDRNKYVNLFGEREGQLMDDAEMRVFLDESYTTMITDGALKDTKRHGSAGSQAGRHKAHRQLFWKDGDAYLEMMEKYGSGNVFDMINGHIETMSRDIAMIEKWSPQAHDMMQRKLQEAARIDTDNNIYKHTKYNELEKLMDWYVGKKSGIESIKLHRFFQGLRNIQVSALLGSMTFAQLGDQATLKATANINRIPATQLYINQVMLLANMSGDKAAYIRRQGAMVEHINNSMARWGDNSSSLGVTGKLAASTIILAGSHRLTNAVRGALQVGIYDTIGMLTRKYDSKSKLDAGDLERMESFGVTDTDWAIWKAAKIDDNDMGHTILTPENIDRLDIATVKKLIPEGVWAEDAIREARLKLLGMAVNEAHMASVSPTMISTYKVSAKADGTWKGELWAMLLQFKTFPVALFMQHIMQRSGAQHNRVKYLAGLAAGMTAMGAVGLLLNDLASGRDPQEIYNEEDGGRSLFKFGTKAFLKGGGIGILGDLLLNDWSDRNKLSGQFGPGLGLLVGVGAVAAEGITGLVDKDKDADEIAGDMAKRAVIVAKQSIPFQNLWYIKAAFHGYLLNYIHEMVSPGYIKRLKQSAKRNFGEGTEYWMGSAAEESRMPNVENIVGKE